MLGNNKFNKSCQRHKIKCEYFCNSANCSLNRVLCEKCIEEHTVEHQKSSIHGIAQLSQIHSFDKTDLLKNKLVDKKKMYLQKLQTMYSPVRSLLSPLSQKLQQFYLQSRASINKKLSEYLRNSKNEIESIKIIKSNVSELKKKPQKILEQLINQSKLIESVQQKMKKHQLQYSIIENNIKQMCEKISKPFNLMIDRKIKLLQKWRANQNNDFKDLQENTNNEKKNDKSDQSSEKNQTKIFLLEQKIIEYEEKIKFKNNEYLQAKKTIKNRQIKIQQLSDINAGLKSQIVKLKSIFQNKEKQQQFLLQQQRKAKQAYIINNQFIVEDTKSLNFQKKSIGQIYFTIIFQMLSNPSQIILSSHQLTQPQLLSLTKYTNIKTLKMNFISRDLKFLNQYLPKLNNLQRLELNSVKLTDQDLSELSPHLKHNLKHISLKDNEITDNGLQFMFRKMRHPLQSLFVSYNMLTSRSIQVINQHSYGIKVLHIAKNKIRSGGTLIGKFLKDLQELFIGDTEITKQGFFTISRNCSKLEQLSLVGNELSIEIISELILGLQNLIWLNISYTGLNKEQTERIDKLKLFNQKLTILSQK